jgi:hypothetical protein
MLTPNDQAECLAHLKSPDLVDIPHSGLGEVSYDPKQTSTLREDFFEANPVLQDDQLAFQVDPYILVADWLRKISLRDGLKFRIWNEPMWLARED